jgi:hypothetical protein
MNLTDREMLARILGLVEGSGSIDKSKLVKEITDHLEKPINKPAITYRNFDNILPNNNTSAWPKGVLFHNSNLENIQATGWQSIDRDDAYRCCLGDK